VEKSENYVKAIVLGHVSLGDVNDVLDLDLEAEEVDTIAGLFYFNFSISLRLEKSFG